MSAETKFIVGQEYFYRFACDWDTKSYMTVVSRTEKTAMILGRHDKKPVRRKINNFDGVESISAGNYSMAGLWKADKQDKEEVLVPDAPRVEEVQEPSNLVPFVPRTVITAPIAAHGSEIMGRKLLVEALESQGRKTDVDLICAIIDRDYPRMLETLRAVAGI